jgi:hypothetical protein
VGINIPQVRLYFHFEIKTTYRHSNVQFMTHRKNNAIYCFSGWGAMFGCDRDLFISGNANVNQYSYTNLGDTYQAPEGYQCGTPQTKALLAGSFMFTPTEIEVFCC